MSATGCLLKTVRAAACLVVMIFWVVLFTFSNVNRDIPGWSFLGYLALPGAIVTGFVMLRIIWSGEKPEDHSSLDEMEAAGLVFTEEYEATRAFEIDEYEDEGMCFMLELTDGRTLCLRGQYLYEFEDASRFGQSPTIARFPNTRFQIKRLREGGSVLDLVPMGTAFHPKMTVPGHVFRHYQSSEILQNGEITQVPFDELMASQGRLPVGASPV